MKGQRTDSDEHKEKSCTTIDFDIILSHLGLCGRYQLFLVFIVYYTIVPCGMHQVVAVFISAIPTYRCFIPGIDDSDEYSNVSHYDIMNATSPINENYDACTRYKSPPGNCSSGDISCWNTIDINSTVVKCESFVFETTVFASTVATEWDLVCDRSMIGTVATAIYFFGVLIGAIAGGVVSDWVGRVPTLVCSQMGLMVAGIACAFSGNVVTFIALRFLLALFVMATTVIGFVYVMEITGGRWRTVLGIYVQGSFAVGYMILSLMAMRWRNWRDLQIAISLVSCPVIFFWLILPESPRWLFSKGQSAKAKAISYKIAKWNNVTLPKDIWDIASVKKSHDSEKKYSPLVLLSLPRMRMVTLNVAFNWFIIALIYYGLSLNIGTLVGSVYTNNVLSGVVELLAFPIVIFTMEKFGRRTTMTATLLYGGLSCLGATVAKSFSENHSELSIVAAVLALGGKFAISGAFAVVYNLTAELYPTVVRSTGVGVGSMAARFGTVFTPFALHIQKTIPWLTGTLFGVLAIFTGGLSLLLPETKGAPLLMTLTDAEEFYCRAMFAEKSLKPKEMSEEDEEIHSMI